MRFRGLYSYRQWVRFITLFPNNVFLLLLHVERVCKSFERKAYACKWLICIMQRVHFQVGVGVFMDNKETGLETC